VSSRIERIARAALLAAWAALIGLFASPSLWAASATANLSVTASVASNCTISTSVVAFGSYDPIVAHASTPLDSTGSVTIRCTRGTATTVGLGLGANASGSTRRMTDGADFMTYELYKDNGRTQIWGNSGTDLLTPAVAPSSAPRSFTVYGRVDAAQDVEAGNYSDTVVATVNW
jgi:spore coat protein U-like protein